MPKHFPDNPLYLYRIGQVRRLEQHLIQSGIEGFCLMQRAATACLAALTQRWPDARSLTVLAGAGKNAGDGYLVAALAQAQGFAVQVLSLKDPTRLTGDAALAVQHAQALGVMIRPWQPKAPLAGVVVDALLGIGCKGFVQESYASAIEELNQSAQPVVSIDVPSGLCADTGQVLGVAVKASLTVTLLAAKVGLVLGAGAQYAGEVTLASLRAEGELALALAPALQRLERTALSGLAPRAADTHKGQLGHVLVVGGDRGTGGAALLSAQMALRAGSGLVSLATRAEHISAALVRVPEVMSQPVASAAQLLKLQAQASVLVVGPGLGQQSWGRSLLSVAATAECAQVWDADALNLLAQGAVKAPQRVVLTPHPGEAARLLGLDTKTIQADRVQTLEQLVTRFNCVIVLKGAGTLIGAPGHWPLLCERGHPVMAGAGLGDVLAGLIGALLAQGLTPWQAAPLAVWLHACAGESLAACGRGLAAHDLLEPIRALLEELSNV